MKPHLRNRQKGHVVEVVVLVSVLLALGLAAAVLGRSTRTGSLGSSFAAARVTATPVPTTDAPTPTTNVPTPTPLGAPTQTPEPNPTLPPTVVLPPMTPVPSGRIAVENPTPSGPEPTPFQPEASDPYNLTVHGERTPDRFTQTRDSTIVAIGTVKQVMPARWSTADGKRPPNPHATNNHKVIFRPVLIEVEQYLRGQQPQPRLIIFALGGSVGRDSVTWASDDLDTFQEGERVIVYLVPSGIAHGASPVWHLLDRFSITEDGQAINSLGTVPLQQLIDEVQQANSR